MVATTTDDGDDDYYYYLADGGIISQDEISSLSNGQEIAISLTSIIPGILSIVGSSLILFLIVVQRDKQKKKKHSPYRRIMFATSCCDIIATCAHILQPFLLPAETSQWIWAIGRTDTSCTVLGTLTQFGFSSHWYAGFLSFYFLWTVRYGIPPERIARYEPYVHAFIISWSLATAISGAVIGLYRPVEIGPGCWVKSYPRNCGSDDDQEPCKSKLIAWIFGGVPSISILLCLIVNNVIIYRHVRHTVMRGVRRFALIGLGRQGEDLLESQQRRVRAVGTQSFLYVGAYFLTYVWSYATRILESLSFDAKDQDSLFFLLILQSLFVPMQGFFNALIFLRPQYLKCRHDFKNESKFWCVQRAIIGESFPPRKNRHPTIQSSLQARNNSSAGGAAASAFPSSHMLTANSSSAACMPSTMQCHSQSDDHDEEDIGRDEDLQSSSSSSSSKRMDAEGGKEETK